MDFILREPSGPQLILPVNPEEITVRREKQYETVNIMNLGEVDFPTGERVKEVTFSSFFPREYDPSYCNHPNIPDPRKAMEQVISWTSKGDPVQLIIDTYINMLVLISAHTSVFKGGHPGDIYYSLTCRSWRDIKVRTAVQAASAGSSLTAGKVAESRPDVKPVAREYSVRPGDSLWAIAKMQYGDGNRWKDIYNNNKGLIGPSPDLIHPGMKLVMPR